MKTTEHGPLTPTKIDALKPRPERYEVNDANSPGLRLRVSPTGVKTFRWSYRDWGSLKTQWITLGQWSPTPREGFLTLSQARDLLDRMKAAHKDRKLHEIVKPKEVDRVPDNLLTVTQLVEGDDGFRAYLRRIRLEPEQGERPIDKDILPAIGGMAVVDVKTADVRTIVKAVVKRGSTRQAGVVLAVARQLFGFSLSNGIRPDNPVLPLDNPGALGIVNNISQRVLTPDEIRDFWLALDAYRGLTPTVRDGLKVILLTGVRSQELLLAEISEFAGDVWTVPVAHQKLTRERARIARPWPVPIGPEARRLVMELRTFALSIGSRYLMASTANEGERLSEKALNHAMRRLYLERGLKFEGERPTPHDLRRTVRTGLGELGVPWHVAERCLNHSLGKIATTYDVGDYITERREALQKWEGHLLRLTA